MHLRAAANNAVTSDEITEVLLQCATYYGIPAANAAFQIACEVFAEPASANSRSEEVMPIVCTCYRRKGFACAVMMDCIDLSWTRMELCSISTAATPSKFSETCSMRIMYRDVFWLLAGSQT